LECFRSKYGIGKSEGAAQALLRTCANGFDDEIQDEEPVFDLARGEGNFEFANGNN
jgi:hypothetical protein